MKEFWAIQQGRLKVPLAVGLLLRNRMIEVRADSDFSWQRQRNVRQRYRITAAGKKFLHDAVQNDSRVS